MNWVDYESQLNIHMKNFVHHMKMVPVTNANQHKMLYTFHNLPTIIIIPMLGWMVKCF